MILTHEGITIEMGNNLIRTQTGITVNIKMPIEFNSLIGIMDKIVETEKQLIKFNKLAVDGIVQSIEIKR